MLGIFYVDVPDTGGEVNVYYGSLLTHYSIYHAPGAENMVVFMGDWQMNTQSGIFMYHKSIVFYDVNCGSLQCTLSFYHYCGRSGSMELMLGAGSGGWVGSYTSVGLMMSNTDYNYSTGSGSADGSLTGIIMN